MIISIPKVSLDQEMAKLTKPWLPVDLVQANDQVIRLALFKGEFHWHHHQEDELFYVLKGEIVIQLKHQPNLKLSSGEMAVIPKKVEHCPKADQPAYILLFEPTNLNTRGD